ncbi:MAG: RelA/SpoT domain-containing protein [Tepidisphaeraceae bacterium]
MKTRIIFGGVAYAQPNYSRSKYDQAGAVLANRQIAVDDPRRTAAVEIVGDWRMAHVFPLERATAALNAAMAWGLPPGIPTWAFVSSRIKRLESVESKLRRGNSRLTQIQDIGGCRAVILNGTKKQLDQIATAIESRAAGLFWAFFKHEWTRDYIAEPKDDGYRGIHLIMSYDGPEEIIRGLRIEAQLRTKNQHLWSTAVEICEFFTQKKLRAKEKTGDKIWQRFFLLTSGYFASIEGMPAVPGTPPNRSDLIAEIRDIDKKIKALVAFPTWTASFQSIPLNRGFSYFILDLVAQDRCLTITPFTREYLADAERKYMELENAAANDPSRQVVLVSAESFNELEDAYPNYFARSAEFCAIIGAAID